MEAADREGVMNHPVVPTVGSQESGLSASSPSVRGLDGRLHMRFPRCAPVARPARDRKRRQQQQRRRSRARFPHFLRRPQSKPPRPDNSRRPVLTFSTAATGHDVHMEGAGEAGEAGQRRREGRHGGRLQGAIMNHPPCSSPALPAALPY